MKKNFTVSKNLARIACGLMILLFLSSGTFGAYIDIVKMSQPQKYALLIGINEYEHLPNLKFCVKDAEGFRDVLVGIGFDKDDVWCPFSSKNVIKPTKKNILDAIANACNEVQEFDMFVLVLSGHGRNREDCPYFGAYDTQLGDDSCDSSIAIQEIFDLLGKCPARNKVLITDCSLEGGSDNTSWKVTPTCPWLNSSGQHETTHECPDLGHGVFIHYLLEGLSGKAVNQNGQLNLNNVFVYAALNTEEYVSDKFNCRQCPVISGPFAGDFVLGTISYSSK